MGNKNLYSITDIVTIFKERFNCNVNNKTLLTLNKYYSFLPEKLFMELCQDVVDCMNFKNGKLQKYKVQVVVNENYVTRYYDVYVLGSNIIDVRASAINFVKSNLRNLYHSLNAYVDIGNERSCICSMYDNHTINAIYNGDWYGQDELLFKKISKYNHKEKEVR